MNRNRIQLAAICAFVFVLVFATVAAAHGAKVDGQWKLTLQSPNGPEIRTLVFTSSGGRLTGAMKAGSDDIAITGTIDGNKITFKISPHGDGPFTFTGAWQIVETWRAEYNESRPHRALGERTPNEFANELAARLRLALGRDLTRTRRGLPIKNWHGPH